LTDKFQALTSHTNMLHISKILLAKTKK